MFDATTLKPLNSYKFLETKKAHNFEPEVEILHATVNSYRFCHTRSFFCDVPVHQTDWWYMGWRWYYDRCMYIDSPTA